jgi:cytochrome b6-f complex iron-sulfur subunit
VKSNVTPTRRHVVTTGAAGAVGLAAAALTGCGRSSSSTSGASSPGPTTSDATPDASGSAPGSGSLAELSAVPVGGAIAAKGTNGEPIVIAQPEAGKVVAFSAVCTHRGCTVAPSGKKLVCPCHGSRFDAFTGAVLAGPASSPLPAVAVTVDGGNVVAAVSRI